MPMQLTPADRKILFIAGGLFLVMVVASILFVRGSNSDDETATIYSAASQGCKAAFLLLKESGYPVQVWEQSLVDLPDGKGKTLLILDPPRFLEEDQQHKLAAFLQSGGHVIAAGQFSAFFLPVNNAVSDELKGTIWNQIPALTPSPITRAAPEITMAPQWYWQPNKGAINLYGDDEKPVVVEYKVGNGKVLWIAAATPLTNAGLKEKGNLEFFLAAVGEPAQTQILWDEYIHGYKRFAGSANHAILAWIGLQIAVLLTAVLLTYSRRSGPVWIPQSEVRLSPLEFVRTLGSLYEQANAGGVAIDICYQRFRYLLTRRFGLSVNSSVENMARTLHNRRGLSAGATEEAFSKTLSDCDSYRYDARVPSKHALRLIQALFDYSISLKLISRSSGEKKTWKRS